MFIYTIKYHNGHEYQTLNEAEAEKQHNRGLKVISTDVGDKVIFKPANNTMVEIPCEPILEVQ